MVKSFFRYIVLIVFVLSNVACTRPLLKNGDYTEKTKILNSFSSIDIYNLFEVTLIQDSNHYVVFKGAEAFISKATATIDTTTDKLFIDYNISGTWLREYEHPQVEVHFTNINRIDLREPCDINTPDTLNFNSFSLIDWSKFSNCYMLLNTSSLNFAVSFDNAGNYIFEGKANNASIWLRGSSTANIKALTCNTLSLKQQSIGSCMVYVIDKFTIDQYRKGEIWYNESVAETTIIQAPYPELIHQY